MTVPYFRRPTNTENIYEDIDQLKAYKSNRRHLLEAACRLSQISVNEVMTETKSFDRSAKRFRVMYLLRGLGLSYPLIGMLLNRHYSSVIHGVQVVKRQLEEL